MIKNRGNSLNKNLRQFFSHDLTGGDEEHRFPKGAYQAILLRAAGVNVDTYTTLHEDYSFQITVNGHQTWNIDGTFLHELNNQMYGNIEDASVEDAAFALTWIIPFGDGQTPNALHVEQGDNVVIKIIHASTVATDVLSGTIRVCGIMSREAENYTLNVLQQNVVASGAATLLEPIYGRNIADIYIGDPSDKLGAVQLIQDGMLVTSCTWDELIALQGADSQLEEVDATYAQLSTGDSKLEALGDKVELELTFSAAATAKVVKVMYEYDQARINRSKAKQEREIQQKLNVLTNMGSAAAKDLTAVKSVVKNEFAEA